ncbi:hypothetical protein RHMOL_Rhmol02G0070800 [Rhododendron molle]|uniref:Uncharacterized protein n=1 Tax=Rhododendron molle TaxID=49168 RepID=A0ACC0PM89_RHOML|nr:hypothetical protein RHMOL_Rhmol02G0070800 [Rhododendron molle]
MDPFSKSFQVRITIVGSKASCFVTSRFGHCFTDGHCVSDAVIVRSSKNCIRKCLGNQKSGLLKAWDEERCALAEKVASAVLHLETIYHNNSRYDSEGTGFIISRFGHSLTDAHCASEDVVFQYFKNRFRKCLEAVVMVKSLGNQELNLGADILYVDPSTDLACKVRLLEDYAGHVFKFCYKVPKSGQSILALGNPDNCKNATRVGIISGIPLYLCNISLENLESCFPYHKSFNACFVK